MSKVELNKLEASVSQWRDRLMDISRFMWVLNESIAHQANTAN